MIRSLAPSDTISIGDDQLERLRCAVARHPADRQTIHKLIFNHAELYQFWHSNDSLARQPTELLLLVAAGMKICDPQGHRHDIEHLRKLAHQRQLRRPGLVHPRDYDPATDHQISERCLAVLEELTTQPPSRFAGGRKELESYRKAVAAERTYRRQVGALLTPA